MKKFLLAMFLILSVQFSYAENSEPILDISQSEMQILQQKANLGNVYSQFKLGFVYQQQNQYQLANKWYEKASKNNMGYATHFLANNYLFGRGVKRDDEYAFKLFEQASQQGFLKSNYMLGSLYEYGRGISKNENLAIKKYEEIGLDDDSSALALTKIYCNNQSSYYNKDACLKWMAIVQQLKADENTLKGLIHNAKLGNVMAQVVLGDTYLLGLYKNEKIAPDYPQAIYWFTKASEQQNDYAQRRLGQMYQQGYGVKQDIEQSKKYFILAANQGNEEALYHLGFNYLTGRDFPADHQQAGYWVIKAANQNYAPAQNLLGAMHINGLGVKKDRALSLYWYKKACDNGDKGSCWQYNKLSKENIK